jgi:hypothetical protein
MKKAILRFATAGLAALFFLAGAPVQTAEAQSASVKISAKTIPQKDHKKIKRQFQTQVVKVNRQLKRQAGSGRKPLHITSINVIEDCNASVTCGDGTTISCSIQGPGSCESGTFSVACIQGNVSEVSTCSGNQ